MLFSAAFFKPDFIVPESSSMKPLVQALMLALGIFSAIISVTPVLAAPEPQKKREPTTEEMMSTAGALATETLSGLRDHFETASKKITTSTIEAEKKIDKETRTMGRDLVRSYKQIRMLTADERVTMFDVLIQTVDVAKYEVVTQGSPLKVTTVLASVVTFHSLLKLPANLSMTRLLLTTTALAATGTLIASNTNPEIVLPQIDKLRKSLVASRLAAVREVEARGF